MPLFVPVPVSVPLQFSLCAYMIVEAVKEYRSQEYVPICNKFDPSRSGMATVLWLFYLSKVGDFFDTIFIVARGKWRQFSVLHVYHHSSIFMVYWVNVNVGYDGDVRQSSKGQPCPARVVCYVWLRVCYHIRCRLSAYPSLPWPKFCNHSRDGGACSC